MSLSVISRSEGLIEIITYVSVEKQTCTRVVIRGKPGNGFLPTNGSSLRGELQCDPGTHSLDYFTDGSHTASLQIYCRGAPGGPSPQLASPPARRSRPVSPPHPPLATPALIHMPLTSAPNQTFFMLVLGATNACRAHVGDRHARVTDCWDLGRQSSQSSPRAPTPPPSSPALSDVRCGSWMEEIQNESEANVEKDAEADEGAEVAGRLVRGCTSMCM